MRTIPGVEDLGLFRVIGQPNLNLTLNRDKAARYQINATDVQDAIQTAVGGNALTQVLQGEQRYDLVLRYLPQYRDTKEAIENIRLLSPSGERVSLAQLTDVQTEDGAAEIYREGSQRYVAIKYGVRGRDLGSTVEEAIRKVTAQVKLPTGYTIDWAGEYASQQRAQRRLMLIIPMTLLLIFFILYTMFTSAKWAGLVLMNVAMAPVGGLLALLWTGTNFSVSSGVGFLALFGVSVQTGVIMVEYMNQLRARGYPILEAAKEGAVRRFRPILMTMLVASLGLVPAATSHGIGSDSQRPFAIVIVGGLMAVLVMSVFLLPTLYVWFAGEDQRRLILEDGPHRLVALQINAANSAGAVIDIEIAGEAVMFAGGLHGCGIGEMLLDVSGGAQEAFFFAAPQGHANGSVHLQIARLQDSHHFHGDGAAGSVIGGAGAHMPGVEVAAHHHQLVRLACAGNLGDHVERIGLRHVELSLDIERELHGYAMRQQAGDAVEVLRRNRNRRDVLGGISVSRRAVAGGDHAAGAARGARWTRRSRGRLHPSRKWPAAR
jgi:preprotein translocase subunit SecF